MYVEALQKPAVSSLDAYMLDTLSGTMAAGLAANAPVYSVRWTNSLYIAVIRRVSLAMSSLGTGFTAGVGKFELFAARSFSASDSGGNDIRPTANKNKLRTSMNTTRFGSMRQSATAALTAGTRTLDTNPLRRIFFAVGTATNTVYLQTTVVLGSMVDSDYPLVLHADEGLVIQAQVPATGVWQFNVALEWMELSL